MPEITEVPEPTVAPGSDVPFAFAFALWVPVVAVMIWAVLRMVDR